MNKYTLPSGLATYEWEDPANNPLAEDELKFPVKKAHLLEALTEALMLLHEKDRRIEELERQLESIKIDSAEQAWVTICGDATCGKCWKCKATRPAVTDEPDLPQMAFDAWQAHLKRDQIEAWSHEIGFVAGYRAAVEA